MSYKVVFFDIDFTLVNKDKEIAQDTIEAIHQLKKNGFIPAIASGRPLYMCEPIAKTLGIDTIVCINGSLVMNKGKIIHKHIIKKEALAELEEHAFKNGHALSYVTLEGAFANQNEHPYILECFNELKFPPPEYRPKAWSELDTFQVLVYCIKGEEHPYQPMESIRFLRTHDYTLDGISRGSSKAKGIEVLLEHLNIDRSQAVAFGDGLNDLEMISYVGMGVAMGNAHEELKSQANFITKSVDNGGIAYGLRQLNLIK